MNLFIKKHSSILKENSANGRRIINLLNKKVSNKILKINMKSNNNILIKTISFNFSSNDNLDKNASNNNTINLSDNPQENLKAEFSLNLNEEQKINFDAFYQKMKENIDSLVEINKKLKEDANL